MRIVVRILISLMLAYILIMPFYLNKRAGETLCSKVVVTIKDSTKYQFVTKERIVALVSSRRDSVLGHPVNTISADKLEKQISGIREIRSVDVWFDIEGTMNIVIDQRNPIMRVIPDDGGDYLVDDEGIVFRRSAGVAPRLHIVGGNIRITGQMLEGVSILDTINEGNALRDVYQLISFINNDKFWTAQIDQIYVNTKNELELVPRVGSHIVKLGPFEDYSSKLENLGLFYEQVMPETGWDSYSEISLEYSGQIVCKRRL